MSSMQEMFNKVEQRFEDFADEHIKLYKKVIRIEYVLDMTIEEKNLYYKLMREKVDIELPSEIFATFEFLNKRIDELEKRIEETKKDGGA